MSAAVDALPAEPTDEQIKQLDTPFHRYFDAAQHLHLEDMGQAQSSEHMSSLGEDAGFGSKPKKVNPPNPVAKPGTPAQNVGASCWKKCGGVDGPCPQFCGSALCCRKKHPRHGCDGKMGSMLSHRCAAPKPTSPKAADSVKGADSKEPNIGRKNIGRGVCLP